MSGRRVRATRQESGGSGSAVLVRKPEAARIPSLGVEQRAKFLPGRSQSLDSATLSYMEPRFSWSFANVRIHTDDQAVAAASRLGARAYTYGNHIVFNAGQYSPTTRAGRQLLAHELTHVVQSRGVPLDGFKVEGSHGAVESEAARSGRLVSAGLPAGPIRQQATGVALTPASAAITPLISYSATDWVVTATEETQVLALLRADTNLSATITQLEADGMLGALISRVDDPAHRFELLRLLGAGLNATALGLVEPHVRNLGAEYELQLNLGRLGVTSTGASFNTAPYASLISSSPSAPFTGVGATGINPTTLDIPWADRGLLAAGHGPTTARYSNPIPGSLPGYLATLTAAQRTQQAELLLNQAISSVDSASYAGNLPSRAEIFKAAGKANNLEPSLVAAFILAEQRDQSRNEDAKDYTAAASVRANTSIGLGQVVISTARRNDLFQDLQSTSTRGALSHGGIARLLASDEYNIFASARYIRKIADDGSSLSIASLPATQAEYPSINMAAYKNHSSLWPADNIRALGSEYTSRAWDDSLVPAWGDFVYEAYQDIRASGVL